jgi:Na+/H+ antiporter NhaA
LFGVALFVRKPLGIVLLGFVAIKIGLSQLPNVLYHGNISLALVFSAESGLTSNPHYGAGFQ